MTTTFKPNYSGAASAITITLASLTNTSYRQSTAVDNTTNLYQEAHLQCHFKTGASGVSATAGYIAIFLAGYDGSNYSNNASGSDAAFTPDLQANLTCIDTIQATANATTYYSSTIYVAAAAGLLWLPQKWAIIVYNGTGGTFDTTGGNFLVEYQGMNTVGV